MPAERDVTFKYEQVKSGGENSTCTGPVVKDSMNGTFQKLEYVHYIF